MEEDSIESRLDHAFLFTDRTFFRSETDHGGSRDAERFQTFVLLLRLFFDLFSGPVIRRSGLEEADPAADRFDQDHSHEDGLRKRR